MRHRRRIGRARTWMLGAVAAGALGAMPACVSYTSAGNAPENNDRATEVWGIGDSIVEAVDELIRRHPVEGVGSGARYVVNLPEETTRERSAAILDRLPDGAVAPDETMRDGVDAPVYHISRVWLRTLRTKVDVVFPRETLGGEIVEGAATVWVRRGPLSRRVERVQYWSPGVVPVPDLHVPVDESEGDADGDAPDAGVGDDQDGGDPPPPRPAPEPDDGGDGGDGAMYREVGPDGEG